MDVQVGGMPLIGREHECAELDHLLQLAAEGLSHPLVVRGEPGIGKTTLLEYAVSRAEGMSVLRATGVQAESDVAFAGLFGLLRPILDRLPAIPKTQARALEGALGLASSTGDNRFLVSAAVLSLLAAAADERPLLCVIDDAQWLDIPSADALVFAARRLLADRVTMLFGARDGEAQRFEGEGLAELHLVGLAPYAARRLIERAAPVCAGWVRDRLLTEAEGNPLALTELPGGLSEAMLAGAEPLPEAIPLTPRLQGVFRRQIEGLPSGARLAILIAAADDTGEVATLLAAAAALALPPEALDDAEHAGLLQVRSGNVIFRHPLVRAAVYDSATTSQKQRVHQTMARVLKGAGDADRRVWHQAMATLTADEEVAAELELSARRSTLRSAHASAATAFLRAAELSTDEDRREQRLAEAAKVAWAAGQVERARGAIAAVLATAGGELRARLLHLGGVIDVNTGSLHEGYTKLREGAELTTDPEAALEMLLEAVEAATFSGETEKVKQLAERGAALSASSSRGQMMIKMLEGFVNAYAGDATLTRAALAKALELTDGLTDPRALLWASTAASVAGSMGDGLDYATRAVDVARQQGLLNVLPLALQRQAGELLRRNKLDQAYAAAVEAHRLGLDLGYAPAWCVQAMSSVEAMWGRDEEALAHAEQARSIGLRTGETFLTSSAHYTIAFIDLSRGRWEQAADRLLELVGKPQASAHPFLLRAALPDLVEAAARSGRTGELASTLEAFRHRVSIAPTPAGSAMLARCEALVAPAQERFDAALSLAQGLSPFQRARTELVYGEWLRRERQRQEARVHLRSALDTFRSLGTTAWMERAEGELRATGETVRRRVPETLDQLTPQEVQIAGLVGEGLTNRDIAGRLYISPRTVDYHLRKVFTKLGISSRAELIRSGAPVRSA